MPRFSASILRLVLIASLAFALPSAASSAGSAPPSFADLAEKLLPAVVNISTTQTIAAGDDLGDLPPDLQFPPGSPFEEFFHHFKDNQQQKGGKKHKATALGSGFIVDSSGYVVTNNHVIQDADEIKVILQDNTNLDAKVIGRDKKTDLAVLKVNSKKPLPAVSFGDSNKIRVGDWIIAIGNPYGLGGTVTAGIISARARDIQSGPYDEYLQTDAPINRGNSGGPMFNMDGEVVGVNTAIFSPSGGSIGIGFAIPSSLVKNIADQLREHGKIRRGWLGVHIQSVTPEIAQTLSMSTPKGALIAGVSADGPAEKGGIQTGDVILSFDGKDISEMRRLPLMVAETEVDKTVNVKILRKGEEVTLRVKVGELKGKNDPDDEDEKPVEKPTPSAPAADKVDDLGISVSPVNDKLRSRFDIAKNVKGLVVIKINPDSITNDQGLQVGDVISEAAQQELQASKELADLVKTSKKDNKPLLLLVHHKDDMRFVAIRFDKAK